MTSTISISRFINNNTNSLNLSLIAITSIILCYVAYSVGLLTNGYNFTDYYQIIDTKNDIRELGFFSSLIHWFHYELTEIHRWRLNYRFCIHVQAYFFGTNYPLWNIARLLNFISVFTIWSLLFLRIRINVFTSILLALMVVLGYQSYTFYRFGPNITYALIPFSLCMYYIMVYYKSGTINKFPYLLTTIALTIAFLSKETMALVLPSFIFLHLFYLKDRKLKLNNYISPIYFLGLFSLYILAIKLIGSTGTGYAGIDYSTPLMSYPLALFTLLTTKFRIASAVLLLFLLMLFKLDKRKATFAFLFFSSLTLLQVVVYHKSGFKAPRYYYPLVIAFPLTIGLCISEIAIAYKNQFVSLVIFILTSICLISIIKDSKIIRSIKYKVNYTTQFSSLINDIKANTNVQSSLLIVGDPAMHYEWITNGMKSVFKEEGIHNNIQYYPIEKEYDKNENFMNHLKSDFLKKVKGNIYSDSLSGPDYTIVISSKTWNNAQIKNENHKTIFLKENPNFTLHDKLGYQIGEFAIFRKSNCNIENNKLEVKHNHKVLKYRITNINNSRIEKVAKGKNNEFIIAGEKNEKIRIIGKISNQVSQLQFCINDHLISTELRDLYGKFQEFSFSLDPSLINNKSENLYPIIYSADSNYVMTDNPPINLEIQFK